MTVMTVEELESLYYELETAFMEMDGEVDMARQFGCSGLIADDFFEERDRIWDELEDVREKLKSIWQVDPFALNSDLSEMFAEDQKEDEALFEMGYWFGEDGSLNHFESQAR